jgi:hypothetical protein
VTLKENFAVFSKRKEPRQLNPDELKLLAQFANCEISLDELLGCTRGMIEIDFGPSKRSLISHYLLPTPGIRINLIHIENAISKYTSREISSDDLKHWATMLLLNEAYEWEGPNEEEIADKLHELSLPQVFLKKSDRAESLPLQ